MQQSLPGIDIHGLRAALLAFFDTCARPLPWRNTRDPYAVWISEVMSQQTRVETVIPYYERWLERFPDVPALANAAEDDVLKAWEGLGYYSRARNVHAAARLLRERHGGAVPDSWDALRALPGIGDYTAGAVSSIAFGRRHAAIDGNVRRVLARLLDHPAPPTRLLRDVAAGLVPADRPGDFNQALMELGATICTPRKPRCARCPIAHHCAARIAGTQEERPRPNAATPVPTFDMATAVVRAPDGRLLIVRRPRDGLLGGLWCFPAVALQAGDDPVQRALELASEHADISAPAAPPSPGTGAEDMIAPASPGSGAEDMITQPPVASAARPLGRIDHVFSHRRERYHCFIIDATAAAPCDHETAWVDATDTRRALPRAQQRIRSLALAADDARHEVTRTCGRSSTWRSSRSSHPSAQS